MDLYDPVTGERYSGQDTRTEVMICDDDRDPVIRFKERGVIEHLSSDRHARIKVLRAFSTKGEVTVRYQTFSNEATQFNARP